jgi:gustatory receptor
MARARVMKTKKQFCPKTNVFKRKKLHAAASELPVVAVKVRGWRFIDNVKSLQQKTSSSSLEESFHNAIKPVLVIAQLFGVLPVTNVMDVHPVSLQFVWKSVRFFWSLITTISCGLMMLLTCYWTFSKRVEFGKMVPLMFYLTNFMSFFCFLLLAREWPALMRLWNDMEKKLPQPRTTSEKQNLRIKIRSTAAIILTLSLIEHLLSMVSSFALVIDCPRINNIMKAYYVKSFPQVFNYFPYSVAFSVYIKLIHVTSTFIWTFTDLFIMMVSCGLSEKFKLINERMLEEKGKVGEINFSLARCRLS